LEKSQAKSNGPPRFLDPRCVALGDEFGSDGLGEISLYKPLESKY
jgi:hypothetical protein